MTALFQTVLEMSLTASVVIAAVLLVRLLLRRAPKKVSYALWSAVGFRLLCPVSFRSVFSLFRILPKGVTELAPDPVSVQPGTGTAQAALPPLPAAPAGGIPELAVPSDPAAAQAVREAVLDPLSGRIQAGLPELARGAEELALPPAESVGSALTPSAPAVDLWDAFLRIGSVLWIAGVLLILVWALVSYVRLARRMRTAELLEHGVYSVEGIRSPFLMGFVRPKIYVPRGLEPDTLGYVLCHERIHLRRGDPFWKALGFFALTVHWFNPLVWLSFRLMTRDMEMSCDERVLAENAHVSRAYSLSLLSFATGRRFPAPTPLAFGEGDVKRRIRNVLNWKKPRLWVTVLSALVCLAVVAACSANPKEETFEADLGRDGGTAAEEEVTQPLAEEPERPDGPADPERPDGSEDSPEAPASALDSDDGEPRTVMDASPEIVARAAETRETLESMNLELGQRLSAETLAANGRLSAAGTLQARLLELDSLYYDFAGLRTGSYYAESVGPYGGVTFKAEADSSLVEWTFGRTCRIVLNTPSIWQTCVRPTTSHEGDILTLSFYGPNWNPTGIWRSEEIRLFTLLLVPVESADDEPVVEDAEWLATLETARNGFYKLYVRADDTPPAGDFAAHAEEWRLLREEIPGILSTLRAPYGNVTITARNEKVFSPDDAALANILAVRKQNDLFMLDKLDNWAAKLEEAAERIFSDPSLAALNWQEPPFDELLARNDYGFWPYEFTTPDADAIPEESLAEARESLSALSEETREDDTVLAVEEIWDAVPKADPTPTAPVEKNALWPARNRIVNYEQGWNLIGHEMVYLLGMILSTPENEPIRAMLDGVVLISAHHPAYGNYVLVDHGGGLASLYGGLSSDGMAAAGTVLKQGDTVGLAAQEDELLDLSFVFGSGRGRVVFEVRRDGQVLNPRDILDDSLTYRFDNAEDWAWVEDWPWAFTDSLMRTQAEIEKARAEEEARRMAEEQYRIYMLTQVQAEINRARTEEEEAWWLAEERAWADAELAAEQARSRQNRSPSANP